MLNMSPKKYRKLYRRCEKCMSAANLVVHHIDQNRRNNNAKNLQVLCSSCHAIIHTRIINIIRMRNFYFIHEDQLTFDFYQKTKEDMYFKR